MGGYQRGARLLGVAEPMVRHGQDGEGIGIQDVAVGLRGEPLEPFDGLLGVPAAVVGQALGEDVVAIPVVLLCVRDGRWASRSTRAKSGTASGASEQALATHSASVASSAVRRFKPIEHLAAGAAVALDVGRVQVQGRGVAPAQEVARFQLRRLVKDWQRLTEQARPPEGFTVVEAGQAEFRVDFDRLA